MRTVGWLSAAVEKLKEKKEVDEQKKTEASDRTKAYIWDFLVGITVLRGINLVKTPPVVSIPRVRGQTSTRTTSAVPSAPERIPPWTAAP